MRIADFVVSSCLQINNRCLRYLAECEAHAPLAMSGDAPETPAIDMHSVYTENLLARDSRRLASMWWLMKPAWPTADDGVRKHAEDVRKVAAKLTAIASQSSLALRLAAIAESDQEAEAILRVVRRLPVPSAPTWDEINALFTRDSAQWRDIDQLRQLADEVVVQRIAKAYRRSYRLGRTIPGDDPGGRLDEHGRRFHKWVARSAHVMELMKAGLSDSMRAQLWYLDKMSDTLRMREGFLSLLDAVNNVALPEADGSAARACIGRQVDRMNRRVLRLAAGCFEIRPNKAAAMIEQASQGLGLREISFLAPPRVQRETAGGPESAEASGHGERRRGS